MGLVQFLNEPSLVSIFFFLSCSCMLVLLSNFHFLLGPVVGEFPCQNDINLSQAPALPQVRNANVILDCMVRGLPTWKELVHQDT